MAVHGDLSRSEKNYSRTALVWLEAGTQILAAPDEPGMLDLAKGWIKEQGYTSEDVKLGRSKDMIVVVSKRRIGF